jgi:hypothetical protein
MASAGLEGAARVQDASAEAVARTRRTDDENIVNEGSIKNTLVMLKLKWMLRSDGDGGW